MQPTRQPTIYRSVSYSHNHINHRSFSVQHFSSPPSMESRSIQHFSRSFPKLHHSQSQSFLRPGGMSTMLPTRQPTVRQRSYYSMAPSISHRYSHSMRKSYLSAHQPSQQPTFKSQSIQHHHGYSRLYSVQSQPLPKSYYQRSYHSMVPPTSHRQPSQQPTTPSHSVRHSMSSPQSMKRRSYQLFSRSFPKSHHRQSQSFLRPGGMSTMQPTRQPTIYRSASYSLKHMHGHRSHSIHQQSLSTLRQPTRQPTGMVSLSQFSAHSKMHRPTGVFIHLFSSLSDLCQFCLLLHDLFRRVISY